jgi:iron complex outermembrane receptor protein
MTKMSVYRGSTKFSLLCMVSALALSGVPAWAQETPSEAEESEPTERGREIVVTGRSLGEPDAEPSLPVQVLSGEELVHRRRGTLGETLAGLPGVHLDNFGGGASRPVIRGQTLPRIEILTDGATLFDASSVSPDHAITTDPLLLDAIEIQRGPAAAIYGGNALNGAINLIDGKVPKTLPDGGFMSASELRYGTGDREMAVAGRVTAALGPFAIHAEGSRRTGEDYDVPDAFGTDRLRDSFASGSSYAFGASWITGKGYIGAAYTRQNATYGLPGHSHANGVCHGHQDELHCDAHGSFEDPFEGYDDGHPAFIRLRSERVDVRADYDDLLPGMAHTRVRLSYTDYRHDEVDGEIVPAKYSNEAYDARLELTHKPLFGFTGTLGGQYTKSRFGGLDMNTLHLDNPNAAFFDFDSESYGVFLTERRAFGPVAVELAARKDWRKAGLANFRQLSWFVPDTEHNPFSASLGAVWTVAGGYSLALNLSRSQRAPSLRELYASGNNLATNSLEVGLARAPRVISGSEDRSDVLETARSANLTFRKTQGATTFEVGVYHQDIDNYIFARLLDQDPERGHRFLLYTAADATFTGIDGQVSHQLDAESRLTVFGDYVRARLKDENDRLPRIPPARLGLRYEWTRGPISADAEYYRTFGQDRFASYETRTGGYDMLNATLAYRFDIGEGKAVELYARGTNLTNELAFVHTSFVKDQSPLRGRNIVFGMRHQF